MFDCADTSHLSPDERLCEAAAILAAGVLWLRRAGGSRPGSARASRRSARIM